jgi:hypothetical protein
MASQTVSLTDPREVVRGWFSLAYLLLPVALAVVTVLPFLLAGRTDHLAERLSRVLVMAAFLEVLFLAIPAGFYALAAASSPPLPRWPLPPHQAWTAVRRAGVGEASFVLSVGFRPLRYRRTWSRDRCRGLTLTSRPEGAFVGSARRRFRLHLRLDDGRRVLLLQTLDEGRARRAAYALRDLTKIALEDSTYGGAPARELPPAPAEAEGVVQEGPETAVWSGRKELLAGGLLLGILLAIYGVCLLVGWARPLAEPGWIDAIALLMFLGGLWHGILKNLLTHRLSVDRHEVTYTLRFLGLPLRRRRLPLAEVETIRLGFEHAALDTLAPADQAKVQGESAGSVLDRLVERTLVIAGRSRSIRIKGLPGGPAREFRDLASSGVDRHTRAQDS